MRLLALALVATVAAAQEPAARAPAPPEKFEFETLQLVLLMRPSEPTAYPKERLEEIQRQHIGHLGRMAESGRMVLAGPFGNQKDPAYRGACVYRVATPEEARALAEQDPAVQAGRLRVEVLTWSVGKGYVAFPKAPPVAEPAAQRPSPAP